MAQWLRYQYQGKSGLGQVQGDQIVVYSGDLFNQPKATGETIKLSEVVIDIPCTPSKMVAMVDNFHALVTKLEHAVPAEPLYFLKGNNSFLASNQVIRTPKSYSGKVVYEGELGMNKMLLLPSLAIPASTMSPRLKFLIAIPAMHSGLAQRALILLASLAPTSLQMWIPAN